ncbi:hypothetical protein DSC45_29270 [Streptomyces sp. YIM 130001]|uniref:hypothetical protein n=1 Tax=Streptomyces sp. YIM 130001 TaxID=2259644 RepID=UPI000ECDD813|nr:hypothetical protein [Streptomyces sp. YIM 130001]RII11153.1 hypothetical protein DSC45_29270 [Streptomyces sp. YIM 130001]
MLCDLQNDDCHGFGNGYESDIVDGMSYVECEADLAEAVERLRAAEARVADVLRVYLARDPVTGRPVHGRIGRAAQITGWGEQRVKETVTPALAERRRAKRTSPEEEG